MAGVSGTLRKKREKDLTIIAIPHARLGFLLYFLILFKNGFAGPKCFSNLINSPQFVSKSSLDVNYAATEFAQLMRIRNARIQLEKRIRKKKKSATPVVWRV